MRVGRWWCQRCERECTSIPEEAGSPAKCPHCKKWTAVWVPGGGEFRSEELGVRSENSERPERVMPTADRAKELFELMRGATVSPEEF